jgi:hypothetical protein
MEDRYDPATAFPSRPQLIWHLKRKFLVNIEFIVCTLSRNPCRMQNELQNAIADIYIEFGSVDTGSAVNSRHGTDGDENGKIAEQVANDTREVWRALHGLQFDAENVGEHGEEDGHQKHVGMPNVGETIFSDQRAVPDLKLK